jgi:hypothetical protein
MTRFCSTRVTRASQLPGYARRGEEAGYTYRGVSKRR